MPAATRRQSSSRRGSKSITSGSIGSSEKGGDGLMPLVGERRLLLFALLSLVVCALVNPGNFGTVDTVKRLQVERWIRLGEPPVSPADTSGFGVIGRNAVRHAWYGMGQSLLLIPFDALVSATAVPILRH